MVSGCFGLCRYLTLLPTHLLCRDWPHGCRFDVASRRRRFGQRTPRAVLAKIDHPTCFSPASTAAKRPCASTLALLPMSGLPAHPAPHCAHQPAPSISLEGLAAAQICLSASILSAPGERGLPFSVARTIRKTTSSAWTEDASAHALQVPQARLTPGEAKSASVAGQAGNRYGSLSETEPKAGTLSIKFWMIP